MVRTVLAGLTLFAGAISLAACGAGSAAHDARRIATPQEVARTQPPLSVADAVRDAEAVGPGFLNYCPRQPGRGPARYDVVSVPGDHKVRGWCSTQVLHRGGGDLVTLKAHWTGVRGLVAPGTAIFTYRVQRGTGERSVTAVTLIRQSGPPGP